MLVSASKLWKRQYTATISLENIISQNLMRIQFSWGVIESLKFDLSYYPEYKDAGEGLFVGYAESK